jgi:hypothetical protein
MLTDPTGWDGGNLLIDKPVEDGGRGPGYSPVCIISGKLLPTCCTWYLRGIIAVINICKGRWRHAMTGYKMRHKIK